MIRLIKELLNKSRLMDLNLSCLHLFRHLSSNSLDDRQVICTRLLQSDEKFDCAIQALYSISVSSITSNKTIHKNFNIIEQNFQPFPSFPTLKITQIYIPRKIKFVLCPNFQEFLQLFHRYQKL